MATQLKVADADELIDAILAEKGPVKYTDGLSEDNWEQELEQIPLFMTQTPHPSVIDSSPGLTALQQIKYEETTPHGRATVLKDEGNEMFKIKRYREAINLYSQALNETHTDQQLIAVLYCNRSAGHYHIGNYRSSIEDALQSKSAVSTHVKAYVRGAEANYKLLKFQEAIQWCNEGLKFSIDHSKLIEIKRNATQDKKRQERDERKQKVIQRTNEERERHLMDAILLRGIKLASSQDDARRGIYNKVGVALSLEGPHPSCKVSLDDDGLLHWPVLFLYPEYGTSDLIESFNENDRFIDHVHVMFSERTGWDTYHTYHPDTVEIWYEDYTSGQYVQVSVQSTLADALCSKQYVIISGSPSFIVLVKGSKFKTQFISLHD